MGPATRVYFTRQSKTIVLLLIGGDKRTQKRDIEQAKNLVRDL
jgi:putative addiction module killer protein